MPPRPDAESLAARADELYLGLEKAGCGPQEILKVSARLVERVTASLRGK